MARSERGARQVGALVFFVVGVLYTLTAARHVLGGDNGELVAVGASGGVAHPPGYPLYILVLRAAAILPASSPAHRAALATIIIAIASVAALAWAARAWGASRVSSTAVAALYAVSPLAWTLGTHAEVFALNVLVAMLVVGWSSPQKRPPFGREDARALCLGLLAGLGLANHHSIVLLAPVGLYAVVRAARIAGIRAIGAGVVGLALGLTPYASIAMRASATPVGEGCVWGAPRDLSGVVRHFLRAEYGTFQLSISDAKPMPFAHVLALGETLVTDLLGAPLLLAAGLLAFLRTRDRSVPHAARAGHVALVLAFVLAGPVFVSRFNLSAEGLAALVTQRFHLLPLALASILVALSVDACARAFGGKRAIELAVGAAVIVVVARAALSYPAVVEHHRPTTELYLRNVLRIAPERAIILHSGDDRTGGFMYTRCALGLRPDVDAITPPLLLNAWYPEQVSARLGLPIVRGEQPAGEPEPTLSSHALIEQLVATGRPVFVTDWFARNIDRTFPSYPVGPLIRIVARPEALPTPEELVALNDEAFANMDLEPTLPARGTWAGSRMLDYARPWAVLAAAYAARGDTARAEACRRRARALTPR